MVDISGLNQDPGMVQNFISPSRNVRKDIMNEKDLDILLVEDNPGDVRLIKKAFHENRIHHNIHVVEDGAEALNFLYREGEYSDAPRPHIILLDLKLPKKDGHEVLRTIKKDKNLRGIPVIILSSSTAKPDILKCYDAYANSYINKPINFDQYRKIVSAIVNYWLTVVTIPIE